MQPIDTEGRMVRVDDDAPAPIPEIAHWLKDTNPPRKEVRLLLHGIGFVASAIGDVAALVAEGLYLAVDLFVYYCQGYKIAPTKYVSAPGRGIGIGRASPNINS